VRGINLLEETLTSYAEYSPSPNINSPQPQNLIFVQYVRAEKRKLLSHTLQNTADICTYIYIYESYKEC
jgi:hypothetical protein